MTPAEFHARIRRIAKERHFSIPKLEISAGLNKDTIKDWKTSYPSIEKVLKVANTLNVSLDYLVGNEEFVPFQKEWLLPATLKLMQISEEAKLDTEMVETIDAFIDALIKKGKNEE